jgi:hypothetical protein
MDLMILMMHTSFIDCVCFLLKGLQMQPYFDPFNEVSVGNIPSEKCYLAVLDLHCDANEIKYGCRNSGKSKTFRRTSFSLPRPGQASIRVYVEQIHKHPATVDHNLSTNRNADEKCAHQYLFPDTKLSSGIVKAEGWLSTAEES